MTDMEKIIIKKLGFDPFNDEFKEEEIIPWLHDDREKPNPFSKLTKEEINFFVDEKIRRTLLEEANR